MKLTQDEINIIIEALNELADYTELIEEEIELLERLDHEHSKRLL